jgi:putative ABC transport system ATP-binding protein
MFSFIDVSYKGILKIDALEITGPGITSIVGESGSGKTTLLRLLNKMISPERGNIAYLGRPLEEIPSVELRRMVVMLSQTPAIFPGTIRDNLQAGLLFSEKPPADEPMLKDTLSMVHLNKEPDNLAETLSGGEKQRLALARVILMEPDVLLLDEPSAALDDETELLVIEKLASYAREHGKTLIMVTHAKEMAKRYSNWIIELRNGTVIRKQEVRQNAGNH